MLGVTTEESDQYYIILIMQHVLCRLRIDTGHFK